MCALGHDTVEDCEGVTIEMIEDNFGGKVAATVDLLTTPEGETPEQKHTRFRALAHDPCGGLVKLQDRHHNLSTMLGVFDRTRIRKYVTETHGYFRPLAREGRRRWPAQTAAYLNLGGIIRQLTRMAEAFLAGTAPTGDDAVAGEE